MHFASFIGLCTSSFCAMVLTCCAWGITVSNRTHESDGSGHNTQQANVTSVGSVTHLMIGAACQADSTCNSGYCLDGYCVPDIVDVHEHHTGVATSAFGALTPGCVHDVTHRPGYAVDRYGRRTTPLSGKSNCRHEYPGTGRRTTGSPAPSRALGICIYVPLPSGTQVFDCAPYGNPYDTPGTNDIVIADADSTRASGIPYLRRADKPIFTAVRVGNDLWMDGPADAPGNSRRGYGPPYTPQRGDYLMPGYYEQAKR